MTEKRFENRLDKSNVKFNTLNPVWDNEKEDALNVFEMIDLLNEQHETIQFKRKHILCLQSVIQTIDVELQEKGMTKERFEEIKNYWYQKFKGDVE